MRSGFSKKRLLISALFLSNLALGIVAVLFLYPFNFSVSENNNSVYPIKKQIRYGFTVTNTTKEVLEGAKFVAFSPLPLTSTQKLLSIEASHNYDVIEDKIGNRKLEFNLPALSPYSSKNIVITADVALAEKPNAQHLSQQDLNIYTSSEKFVELDSPIVLKVAQQFNNIADKAQPIYQWLVQNVGYTGYVARDRGAAYALKYKKGDCTEYMYSFVALTRSHNIPSRSMAGFWLEEKSNVLRAAGYHNWAEFHDGNQWVLADPQRRNFDDKYQNYIAFRHISEQEDNPMGNTQRFLAYDSPIADKNELINKDLTQHATELVSCTFCIIG